MMKISSFCSSLFAIPQHLRHLRLLMTKFIMINPKDFQGNDNEHLYFGHVLSECLMLLSNASCERLSIAAYAPYAWIRKHWK
jgi:hypothetical protein